MTYLLIFILLVYLVYFGAKWFFKVAMPHIVMWGLNRHIRKKYGQAYEQATGSGHRTRTSRESRQSRNRRKQWSRSKIIPNDVGEYVDFEEIPTYTDPSKTNTSETNQQKNKYKDEPQISDAEWEEIKE